MNLEKIESLREQVTEGPHTWELEIDDKHRNCDESTARCEEPHYYIDGVGTVYEKPDAEFISQAPAIVDWLVARVKALEKRRGSPGKTWRKPTSKLKERNHDS